MANLIQTVFSFLDNEDLNNGGKTDDLTSQSLLGVSSKSHCNWNWA